MTQQPEASRIVEDTSIRILDELAVEGGRASRAHLFDQCQVKLWGHVANVAARRAGYTGQNEAEIERHGKEQLFLEAVNLLLEREQIVVWDEEGKVLALHPTHRDDYVPGTNLWRSQRQQALTELRTQLQHFCDGKIIGDRPFDATLQKAIALFAQQLRRGQLAGDLREDAIAELLALADVLFDPARLASLFGIDESELRAIAARRYEPAVVAPAPKKRRSKTVNSPEDVSPTPSDVSSPSSDVSLPPSIVSPLADDADGRAYIRRERQARGLTQVRLAEALGWTETTMVNAETGKRPTPDWRLAEISKWFREHPAPNGQVQ